MALPTRAQQVGWVVLLTALGVLAAVRVGCGQAAAGAAGDPPSSPAGSFAPGAVEAGGGRGW